MTRVVKIGLVVAGCINLLFLMLHAVFPWLFNWKETLACLDLNNWAILQTFNIIVILMILAMTFFSFRYPSELTSSTLGRPISIVFSLFYFIRIVAEFVYFGYTGLASIVIIALCLIPALVYLLAAIGDRNERRASHEAR